MHLKKCITNAFSHIWMPVQATRDKRKSKSDIYLPSESLQPAWCVLVAQLCPTLCDPMDYSPPGSSVHGMLQARILEWAAVPFSRGSSPPRDRAQVSPITGRFFTVWAICKSHSLGGELARSVSDWNTEGASAQWLSTHHSSEDTLKERKLVLRHQEVVATLSCGGWAHVSQREEGKQRDRSDTWD